MVALRDYIRENAKILALIGLPHLAFQVSGANNEGHLLFIEKVDEIPEDYDIFIDWASDVGIDSIGQKTQSNDLEDISARFLNLPTQNIIRFRELEERIDPWYYHPNYKRIIERLRSTGYPWMQLRDIFSRSPDHFKAVNYDETAVFKYIEKGDVDVERGIILSFSEHSRKTIPNRATYVLRGGDILFPNAYDSMRGITIVPPEFDGYIGTNRFFVMRHKPATILPDFVRYQFTRPEIIALIKRQCTGEINPGINWTTFSKIKVPVPPIEEQTQILADIASINKQKLELEEVLRQLQLEIDERMYEAFPATIENYASIKIRRAEYIGLVEFDDEQ